MVFSKTSYHSLITSITLSFFLFRITRSTNLSIKDQWYLIDQEPRLIDILQRYIQTENDRLYDLQQFKDTLMQSIEVHSNDSDNDIAWNPLAIYKTVKYLTVDFDVLKQNKMRGSYYDIIPEMIEEKTIIFPDENHLYGATRDFVLLQRAHNLTARDIMDGRAANLIGETSLTSEDCLYIGETLAEKHDHRAAVDWLQGCEDRFDKPSRDRSYKTIISSALCAGDETLCRNTLNKCLRENSTHRVLTDLNMKLSLKSGQWNHDVEEDQWESFNTCAGDYDVDQTYPPLKCRYNHHNSIFLRIAPLKEEMMSLEPKISVFREAIYDSEIEQLYADAYSLFRPAGVVKNDNQSSPDLQYRPSQTTFLDNMQPKYTNLWNRLEDMSSLSLKKSESFQMLHYAPGGFYRVHPDYLRSTLPDVMKKGNRIATALMYLNSVPLGGNTVFPRLKLNVQPIKGSVLLWINMRVDGSEETNVKHAACPVIYGEKLACTQWFRMGGQDHWIAESADDTEVRDFMNPNIMCPKRYSSVNSSSTMGCVSSTFSPQNAKVKKDVDFDRF